MNLTTLLKGNNPLLISVVFCVICLSACTMRNKVYVSQDVLRSHAIWKKNKPNRVYLVFHNDSAYTIQHPVLHRDSLSQLDSIIGKLVYTSDSSAQIVEGSLQDKKTVNLFLKDSVQLDKNSEGQTSLSSKQIDSAVFYQKEYYSVRTHVTVILGALITIVLTGALLALITIVFSFKG